MAHLMGLSQNGYSKLERGDTQITLEKLEKIAKALEATLQITIQSSESDFSSLLKKIENLEHEVSLLKLMLARLLSGGAKFDVVGNWQKWHSTYKAI